MSELINTHDNRATIRWKLLTSVSALALAVSFAGAARAEDSDRPTIWIELGGQLDRLETGQRAFAPPFFSNATPDVLAPMDDSQKLPLFSFGENGEITFEPTGSDWLFSVSIRYGRAGARRHLHHQTNRAYVPISFLGSPIYGSSAGPDRILGDGQGTTRESHLLLDFQAGKDLGLGMFGAQGSSTVSAGVRIAQFTSGSNVALHARPTYVYSNLSSPGVFNFHYHHYHNYTAIIQSRRNSHAIGPEISWSASLPIAGNSESASLALDWGINAALLFGRARARTHHQTQSRYFDGVLPGNPKYHSTYVNAPVDRTRTRSVTIPNVGGFTGISFRYTDAKISFGYRGDFFFNAMDTGWDTRKSSMVGFFGPYANLSVGVGD